MTVVYVFFDLESLISCSYINVKMHLQILCISRLPVNEANIVAGINLPTCLIFIIPWKSDLESLGMSQDC